MENEEVLNRLFELKKQYQIEIGLSASGSNQNEIILKALDIKINDVELFDVFQITFNVFDQSLFDLEKELKNRNKKVIIKEVLANGRIFPNHRYVHYTKAYQLLKELAQKYKVGVDAICLRFCMDILRPYLVLSGAIEQEHLVSNLQAKSICLAEEDLVKLKELAVFPENYWKERKELDWN